MTAPPQLAVAAGYFGKLPTRGDFLRSGLPRGFTDPWDAWWQTVLQGSRDLLGAGWTEAWLQAPIWRFALPPGLCGAGGVLGLWLPSVDRAGRYFPLTIAAVAGAGALPQTGGGFLDEVERAGLAAVEQDLPPDALAGQVAAAVSAGPTDPARWPASAGRAAWWTAGSTLVEAKTVTTAALPGPAEFATMIAGPTVAGTARQEDGP